MKTRVIFIYRLTGLALWKWMPCSVGKFPEEVTAGAEHAAVKTIALRQMNPKFLSDGPKAFRSFCCLGLLLGTRGCRLDYGVGRKQI